MKKTACLLLGFLVSMAMLGQNVNFSNTTPAAPSGSTNIIWQHDASSPVNISGYIQQLATGNFSDWTNVGVENGDVPVWDANTSKWTPGPNGTGGGMVYPGLGLACSTGTAWCASLAAPSGAIVGTTDTQTLTNKTLDGVTPASFGYLDATSSIQTQLNAKQAALGYTPAHSGANSDITSLAGLTTLLTPDQGGTGSAPGSGYAYANGDSPFTYSTTIPYASLTDAPTIPTTASWPNAGSCSAGEYVDALTNGVVPICAQIGYAQLSGTPTLIANIQITTATTAIAANSCDATATTVTMSGVATTSTFAFTPSADASGATGWGTGALYFDPWPTAGELNYKRCNGSSASITPTAVTWNVSAK